MHYKRTPSIAISYTVLARSTDERGKPFIAYNSGRGTIPTIFNTREKIRFEYSVHRDGTDSSTDNWDTMRITTESLADAINQLYEWMYAIDNDSCHIEMTFKGADEFEHKFTPSKAKGVLSQYVPSREEFARTIRDMVAELINQLHDEYESRLRKFQEYYNTLDEMCEDIEIKNNKEAIDL